MTTMRRINPWTGSLSLLLFCVLLFIQCVASQQYDGLAKSLRGQQRERRLMRQNHPCILVKVDIEYEHEEDVPIARSYIGSGENENDDGDRVFCELIEDDIERADGHHFVPIVGVKDESLQNIESGVSTFMADGAVFSDGTLQIPQGASIEMGSLDDYSDENYFDDQYADDYIEDGYIDGDYIHDDIPEDDSTGNNIFNRNGFSRALRRQQKRRSRRSRKKRILVVRADAYDTSTSANAAQLSNGIFGTNGDKITLKSQYRKCSHGKVIFAPYDDDTGVLEIQLKRNVTGEDKFIIQDAMLEAATKSLGNLTDIADRVMLCMPKGTGHWIAYAYVNHWLSVFNDDWCQQLSSQMHEFGHNLGLPHSGRGGDDYSDKSGMMGYSFKDDHGPLQCFNPAKNYMLGWYKKGVVEWNPLTKGTWFGNIVGVVDYDGTENVVLKIRRKQNGKDLYIGYNREKSFNKGVKDEGDKVVIVEQKKGYEVSNLLEGLHPDTGASKSIFYNFENSNRNLVIDFMGYGDDDSIDKAFVAIYFEDCKYPECCSGSMCIEPSAYPTKAPTATISREIDPNPVLYELLPNPVENKGHYIEIFNPHSLTMNLKNYMICIKSGEKAEETCMNLTNFDLRPGEYYMVCKSKLSIPDSKTCHQEETFRVVKNRKLFVSLARSINNDKTFVDEIDVPRPSSHLGEIFARKGSQMTDFCGDYCWQWFTTM